MHSPAISVGMPAYNASKTIAAAIESLLNQTFRDFELVISDNASTDDTLEICTHFARQDGRIRVVRQPRNIGANSNYNSVAKLARAKYFKWASANDLLHPMFLERCIAELDANPACVLCIPRTRLFADDPALGEDYVEFAKPCGDNAIERFREVLERQRLNNVMNGVVRREVLAAIGFAPAVMGADAHMIAELALHGKIIEIPETMFYRRMTPETATALQSEAGKYLHVYGNGAWRRLFANWRRCAFTTRAVLRAPLCSSDRAAGLAYVSRYWIWHWRGLLGDIGEAVSFPLVRIAQDGRKGS
jgi:glycosyltransferase involved in cell wall biosynthesis